MIFVTVGTVHYPFNRMASLVEKLSLENLSHEKIVFQHGCTPVSQNRNTVELYATLPFGRFVSCLRRARVVITHGGPGTIFTALLYKKKPFVLPREQKRGEHVNDHQVYFAQFMQKKYLITLIDEKKHTTLLKKTYILSGRIQPWASNTLITYLRQISSINALIHELK